VSALNKLSVIVPVFNEEKTIRELLDRIQAVPLEKEIIIVNDGSTDQTSKLLEEFSTQRNVRLLAHERNQGKGAAIRTAIPEITGEMALIQDGDLEYSPEEYPTLLRPIIEGHAHVVYGSRFLGKHRVFLLGHYLGNRFLTLLTNLLYRTRLTDMETCYKVFRSDVLKSLVLHSTGFEIEPEITAKIFKAKKWKVVEKPITYHGRDFHEGKKITWRDGLTALWTLLKYRFVD